LEAKSNKSNSSKVMFNPTKDWIGKLLSKSVTKSQRLALSLSVGENLAQVQKKLLQT